MISHLTTTRRLKMLAFSSCSVLTREVSCHFLQTSRFIYLFFLSLGVGHLLSFRKININEFSMQEKEFDFGNGNVVRSGNYNFHCILVITWYIYWAMLLLNEN